MAQPTNRVEFKEFCLRKLGKPLLDINVSDEQCDDRLDEALSFYYDYHFNGSQKIYLKHQVTEADRNNGYIDLPSDVIGTVSIFGMSTGLAMGTGMFNVQYQFVLNNINDMVSGNMLNYYMTMENIQLMQDILQGSRPIRYNRHVNRLHIDTDWSFIEVGSFIIAEVYQRVDPEEYSDVWADRWLQNYTAEKIKYQWGSNLTKFIGMSLPGNVQFNGELILKDAEAAIAKLEDEMINSYSFPVSDMIG